MWLTLHEVADCEHSPPIDPLRREIEYISDHCGRILPVPRLITHHGKDYVDMMLADVSIQRYQMLDSTIS